MKQDALDWKNVALHQSECEVADSVPEDGEMGGRMRHIELVAQLQGKSTR